MILNPRNSDEMDAFFQTQGIRRDLTTEPSLKLFCDPLILYSQTFYVYKK